MFSLKKKIKKEEDIRKRNITKIISAGFFFIIFLAFVNTVINKILEGKEYNGLNPAYLFVILIFSYIIFLIAKHWNFKLAANLFISIIFLGSIISLYLWGASIPLSYLLFSLIIIMSGILLGEKSSIIITILIAFSIVIFTILQKKEILNIDRSWAYENPTLADSFLKIGILAIITTISWIYSKEISKSLKKAAVSEKKLKIERDLLEIKVKERTKALKKSQKERELQLYRFSEFGKIASGIFHDLVNPLTAAKLNIDDLQKNHYTKSPENELILKKISQGIDRITKLTELAKRQVQTQKIKERFSPADEILLSIQTFSYKARKENIELNFNFPDNKIMIYGDPIKFYRIICTFIDNALGSYEKTIDKKIKKVTINLKKDKNNLYIQIRDWGCGIKKENIKKIFEPLFTTKKAEKGSGLGLSIAKEQIKNEFSGKIKVKSVENKGSKFTLCIPLKIDKNKKLCKKINPAQ